MRLIHTGTLQLHVFHDDCPDYVVLSHRWCQKPNDEAGLQNFERLVEQRLNESASSDTATYDSPDLLTSSLGLQKAMNLGTQARKRGYDWFWIDTICIYQKNPGEVSEAVNSTFRWR